MVRRRRSRSPRRLAEVERAAAGRSSPSLVWRKTRPSISTSSATSRWRSRFGADLVVEERVRWGWPGPGEWIARRRCFAQRRDRRGARRAAPGRRRSLPHQFTSGTTGMPKCVIHDQKRWMAFTSSPSRRAISRVRRLHERRPTPFGFGIWTSHVTPTLLGVPTVLLPRFSALEASPLSSATASPFWPRSPPSSS